MSVLTISPEVLNVLNRGTIAGNLFLLPPGQLERPLYEAVNKVLLNAGGCWSKKQKGHLFASDPTAILGLTLETGQIDNLVDDAKAEKKAFQAFYTPADFAKHVVELADLQDGNMVLEPSCGEGALLRALLDSDVSLDGITAVELNPEAIAVARSVVEEEPEGVNVIEGDFLKIPLRKGDFDRIVMNPPFSGNQDLTHVARALTLLAPGGILVAIMSPNTARTAFTDLIFGHDFEIEEVPAGTFKESGTNIATIILIIRK